MKIRSTFFCSSIIYITLPCYTLSFQTASSQPGSANTSQSHSLVLKYKNYIVPPNINYVRQGTNGQGVEVPATGNKKKWDYTALSNNDLYSVNISYASANSSYFTSARRKTDFTFALGESFLIQETAFESDDNNAYQRLGRTIVRQAFPLGDLTGFPTDSLIISQQDVFDEGRLNFVAYPCTVTSSWSTAIRAVTSYQLSFAALGLDHTPGEFVQRQTLTRSVVGSGRMRIPDEDKKSKFIDVLMVRSVFTNTDSVYLDGMPAPPEIIAAFGLTQGQVSNDYAYLFLRAGIDEPLINFNMTEDFSAINFIQYDTRFVDIYCGKDKELICENGETRCVPYASVTPLLLGNSGVTVGACSDENKNQFVHNQLFAKSTQLPGHDPLISVYPNPSAGVFYLKLNHADNDNTFIRILDVAGKSVIQFNTREKEISFGSTLKPGVYFVEIRNSDRKDLVRLVKL